MAPISGSCGRGAASSGAARERCQSWALTPGQRATAWNAIEMADRDGFSGLDPKIPFNARRWCRFRWACGGNDHERRRQSGDLGAADAFADDRAVIGMASGPGVTDLVAARAL